ncbi:MAG: hypothetical protein A3G87_09475 [Omnitrophica bacterium RIFCSPLOWO2_12_FULL_50_11]|nr:MAG: hypothetical protein A3G87_09475 [Omnitrophica bacterium RIFCSPLOWO2_12_FULL_50_11]
METIPLKGEYRSVLGKQAAKKLRSKKLIPAVVYGSGLKSTPIQICFDDFSRAIRTKAGENVVIRLTVSGEKNFENVVVIKEIQHNPVTDRVYHVDFNAISLSEKIRVRVPLHVTGESFGVKEGGVLDVIHHEIEVECLPTDIPERLDVDISALRIGDSIHIREMTFPKVVTPVLGADEVVIAVHAPKIEEVPAPEEAPAEPELVSKEKEKEEEGEEASAPRPTQPGGEKPGTEKPDKVEKK